ncbi:AAA family ATPase [Nocardioides pinisoli]|uniref:ATP-binding protein n=1 Tax=Nocardioides pinisoli TaxID=2950279 RepID=A0ABT1KUD0_9ACTN|nr:ATP-binding protein [Nocardioides pinisoli]MCP3421360.1 ATP-binding protein [Nocardioides pinisoli]
MEIVPTNFSVVTGPNGSGKSNLVEALAFLGEVYQFGFEFAVGRYGGIDAIAYRDKRRTTIGVEFKVSASLSASEVYERSYFPRSRRETLEQYANRRFTIDHAFTLKPAGAAASAEYGLHNENLTLSVERADGTFAQLLTVVGNNDASPDDGGAARVVVHDYAEDLDIGPLSELALGSFVRRIGNTWDESRDLGSVIELARLAPVVRHFAQSMGLIRAYRLNPSACRKPAVLTPNAALESDGSNLPAAASRMMKRQPEAWNQVLSSMRQILPDLTEIDTSPSPEYGISLRFQEQERGRPWSAHEVSDGTIQALALFIAAFDPRAPIVLVEEPENAVHPWVLRRFLEVCKSLTEKQTILTTHSPVLLSLVRPEDVFLMWRSAGRSALKPLTRVAPDAHRLYYEEGFDVFSLYDSGMIGEAIPGAGSERG